jgi:hypothetical protein
VQNKCFFCTGCWLVDSDLSSHFHRPLPPSNQRVAVSMGGLIPFPSNLSEFLTERTKVGPCTLPREGTLISANWAAHPVCTLPALHPLCLAQPVRAGILSGVKTRTECSNRRALPTVTGDRCKKIVRW